MPAITERLKHAWNAFRGRDAPQKIIYGESYGLRPDRVRLTRGNERTIVTALFNRIAIDVSSVKIQHVIVDENRRYIESIDSNLNKCLTTESNIDQTGRNFMQDVVLSMLDEGCVAVVPVDALLDQKKEEVYDIFSLRTGKILAWYPEHVRVRLYNEKTGRKEDIVVPKRTTAIIENPLYAVINEPNSTLQRLIRKLSLLDVIDEQSGSGKLDLIMQLPYEISSDRLKARAADRKKQVEEQLEGSKLGIAYIGATEKVTQLNRSVENNLMAQIEYLTSLLYSQLGLTEEVFNGKADETTMLNYNNRTIEPILASICDEFERKFLTESARSEREAIEFFQDPFKLSPISNLADIADRFTRNEILSSNEVRAIIGYKPADDPRADQLLNKNIRGNENPMVYQQEQPMTDQVPQEDEYYDPNSMNYAVDQVDIPAEYYT